MEKTVMLGETRTAGGEEAQCEVDGRYKGIRSVLTQNPSWALPGTLDVDNELMAGCILPTSI